MENPFVRLYWVTKLAALACLFVLVLTEEEVKGWTVGALWAACWVVLVVILIFELAGNRRKQYEFSKLSAGWRRFATWTEAANWAFSRVFALGIVSVLIGGELVPALVWGGLLGLLGSFGLGFVVLVANKQVGFYADPPFEESGTVAERPTSQNKIREVGPVPANRSGSSDIWRSGNTGSDWAQ